MNRFIKNIFAVAVLLFIAYSCANIGYPTGGPKDKTPPKVTHTKPHNYIKDYKGGKIEIFFNEYVKLEKMNEQFSVSPPMKKKPIVKLRGKSIFVKMEGDLRPNTTYTLDFGTGIVDNNEGNKLGNYQFVFSTGTSIDSLGISGKVDDAFTGEKVEKVMVMAYKNTHDSVPLTTIPDYISLTDSVGYFQLKNMSPGAYKLFAIVDGNKDYKYNKSGETIGFIDSLIVPSSHRAEQIDTIKGDSIKPDSVVVRKVTALEPSNIYIKMFKEENPQQYLTGYKHTRREKLYFTFNTKRTDSLLIDFVGFNENPNWFLLNKNKTNDTLSYWITDKNIYNRDTLLVALKYLKTDSLGKLVSFNDTVKMNFKTPKKAKVSKKKKLKIKKPTYKFSIDGGHNQDLNKNIAIVFNEPLKNINADSIHFLRYKDTIAIPTDYQIIKDSTNLLKYWLKCKWIPETKYKLEFDSTAFENIYGLYNKKSIHNISTRSMEYYGVISLEISGVKTNTIIQIIGANKKDKVYQQKIISQNGTYNFKFLEPETYIIKAIEDVNKNGKWDPGNYEKKLLPERVYFFNKEIKLRSNWEQTEAIKIPIRPEFDYKKDHTPKHKMEKDSNKKSRKKGSNFRNSGSSIRGGGRSSGRSSQGKRSSERDLNF